MNHIRHSSAGKSSPSKNGRHGRHEPFTDQESARYALGVAASREPVPADVASRMSPEWAEACLLAVDDGEQGIDHWLKVTRARLRSDPARYEAIASALIEARARGPVVEAVEAKPEGPPPYRLRTIDSRTFFATKYPRDWIVRRILVARQPGIIGGPKKVLKTTILIELAVSLSEAVPFLGEFAVNRPMRVGFFSGESGEGTIQETALRVCASKGIDPEVLDNITWGFELPQLSNEAHLAELARVIRGSQLEVVIIDPLYLCLLAGPGGRQLDPSNLYHMGPLLTGVAKTCLDAGATPLLVHHFRKNRESPYEVPELEELAFAGIQEFARQWLLIGRREKYVPGTGSHRLWLTVGGSSGHSGEWALDVEEGSMDDEFQGRRWDLSLHAAHEARSETDRRRDAEKVERQAERSRIAAEAKEREDSELALKLAVILRDALGGKTSQRKLREATGWDAKKFGRIAGRAEAAGWVRSIEVPHQASKTRTESIPGYELANDPGVIQ